MPQGWAINVGIEPIELRSCLTKMRTWYLNVRTRSRSGQKFYLSAVGDESVRNKYCMRLAGFHRSIAGIVNLAEFKTANSGIYRRIILFAGPWVSFEDEMMEALRDCGFAVHGPCQSILRSLWDHWWLHIPEEP